MSDYHLFRKSVKSKNGISVKHWYYWFYDEYGHQQKKSCRGCSTKREAELYISQLPSLSISSDVTVFDICRNMYIPGSEHCKRREQFGKTVKLITMKDYRRYVDFICQQFGTLKFTDFTLRKIESFLIHDSHSGSWKNRYLEIVSEIYDEAMWQGLPIQKPSFTRFKLNSTRQTVLSTKELQSFLVPQNFSSEMFYVFFFVCVSAGMRLGEIRAFRKCQFQRDKKALIIDGFLAKDGTRNPFNKTGSIDNPRFRVTIIPDVTVKLLEHWICKNRFAENDFYIQ